MLSYQAREYYEYLNRRLVEFEANISLIVEFGNKYKDVTTDILKKIISTKNTSRDSSGTHYIVKDGGIQEQFKNIIRDFKSEFNFFDVFNEYAILKKDIQNYIIDKNIIDDSVMELFNEIDQFFKIYQSFMQSDNDTNLAIDFGQSVKEISASYKTITNAYSEFENNMCNAIKDNPEKDMCEISIQLLGINYTLQQFANNLTIIQEIYENIGCIIYNKETYEKLQVKKIESGSLLSIILGDKNIIETIAILLNKSVNLVFNKFTYEGKIIRHKEFREELMSDIELTARMKELGYDVAEIEKNNKETITILTKDLLRLSSSSPKIKVNDNEYSIKDSQSQKFIETSNVLLLSEGKEDNKTTD